MFTSEKPIEKKTLYKGRILDLQLDKVILPNGKETVREVVRHRPAVGIVAVQDGAIFFVRQFRYALNDFILEIPAGIMEDGETPVETAAREIQEEIGYRAGRLENIGRIYTSPGFCDEEIILFWAEGLVPSRLPADDDEFIDIQLHPFSRVWKMIQDGIITDGKTVAALSRLALEGKIAYH